ncbi:family 16 glycosylhydrolase [Paeniglutamicibacter sp. NPDC012692]|uniref:glycoside hydrolase family 16 protein n=1 Tax=Paeniglutamicibacter sp. NPDC012692 TaxID=3364388 RepID=UPI00368F73E3
MSSRPWTAVLGATLALALVPLLGSSVRPQVIDQDSGSLAAEADAGGFAMPPVAAPQGKDPAAVKPKDKILLDEGFDGNTLDTSIWNTCHWWQEGGCTIGSNEELEWYLPRQVKVSGGALQLTAEHHTISASDGKDYGFASGMVTTGPPAHEKAPKLAFTYGKVEARFRIPTGQGLWPAIWLLPANEESTPEIDILEVLGHDAGRLRMRLHPKDREARSIGKKYVLPDGYTLAGGWHTIAVDWSPGKLVYYLDGRQVWQLVDQQVPDEPMYLVMNLAVGGSFPGPPDADTRFPAVFGIDHVRIRSND